jgi:hydrogenase maturation protein HypF
MATMYLSIEQARTLPVWSRHASTWDDVVAVGRSAAISRTTTSMGRLFDAVASILDVRDAVTYEGQAAVELEQLATRAGPAAVGPMTFSVAGPAAGAGPLVFEPAPVIAALVEGVREGVAPAVLARRFHEAVVAVIVDVAIRLRDAGEPDTVVLTGGVFQNGFLADLAVTRLEWAGFEVLTHALTPPNDGGLSLGQVAVGLARHSEASRQGLPGAARS